MALKATVYKVVLQVSDMDRGYFNDFNLTVARHPSETTQRMMIRILAFALHADDQLSFTRGLSAEDEPEIWLKNYTDDIDLWVELGLPDERRMKKACVRSQQVVLYTYGDRTVGSWWQKNEKYCQRFQNLKVIHLPDTTSMALSDMAQKNLEVQCYIEDGQVWFSDANERLLIDLQVKKV